MKKILILMLITMATSLSFAQDVITLKDGAEIQSKVLKVTDSEVEYKKWTNQDGPTFVLKVDMIFMIKFQNGEKKVLGEVPVLAENNNSENGSSKANVPEKQKTKKRSKGRFNLDVGYVTQNIKDFSENGAVSSWCGDRKLTSGVMAGVSWDANFLRSSDWGCSYCAVGLSFFKEKSSGSDVDEGIPYTYDSDFTGFNIYFTPFEIQYRHEFGTDFAIYALAGVSFDIALYKKLNTNIHADVDIDPELKDMTFNVGGGTSSIVPFWDFKLAFSYKIYKLQVGTSPSVFGLQAKKQAETGGNAVLTLRRPFYITLSFILKNK